MSSTCDPGRSRGQEGGGSAELFAAASFRRSRSGAPLRPTPFQRRGCELPLVLLGPRRAFTEPRRHLTLRRHSQARPSRFRPPDALPVTPLLRSGEPLRVHDVPRRLTCEPRTRIRSAGKSRAGQSPGTPSVVSRTRRYETREASHARDSLRTARDCAPFRLLSTRAPRQAGLRASSWLAPSRSTRPCDLPVRQDARCVQPTSATRTNCVHPHLARSRRPAAAFAAWASLGD